MNRILNFTTLAYFSVYFAINITYSKLFRSINYQLNKFEGHVSNMNRISNFTKLAYFSVYFAINITCSKLFRSINYQLEKMIPEHFVLILLSI